MKTSPSPKLYVDSDDPDDFEEDGEKDVTTLVNSVSLRELVDSNRFEEALQTVVSLYSFKSVGQNEKNELIRIMTLIFQALTQTEVEKIVENLKIEEADTVMAYVFKAMAVSSEPHPILLFWHAKIFEKFGYGAIVRVFSAQCI